MGSKRLVSTSGSGSSSLCKSPGKYAVGIVYERNKAALALEARRWPRSIRCDRAILLTGDSGRDNECGCDGARKGRDGMTMGL